MPTRNVNLTEHFDSFIESKITSGRFSNASEIVREGLRLLEQREEEDRAKLTWLRAATQEALDAFDRGEGIPLNSVEDIDHFIDEAFDELQAGQELTHG
jgi:antitoxin ParD1/3/4